MTHGSLVSKVAARMGSAEFLEPLILTVPANVWPPCTIILSIPCAHKAFLPLVIVLNRNVAIFLLLTQLCYLGTLRDPDLKQNVRTRIQKWRRLRDQPTDDVQSVCAAV